MFYFSETLPLDNVIAIIVREISNMQNLHKVPIIYDTIEAIAPRTPLTSDKECDSSYVFAIYRNLPGRLSLTFTPEQIKQLEMYYVDINLILLQIVELLIICSTITYAAN